MSHEGKVIPKTREPVEIPEQFKFSTYADDVDMKKLENDERMDGERDIEAGFTTLRDAEGKPMGRRRMKREMMMMADKADVFNKKELKYVKSSAALTNSEVVEAIQNKEECSGIQTYKWCVINIISGGMAPVTPDNDVQFRVIYMARSKVLAEAARELVENWRAPKGHPFEGQRFPGTPIVYPLSRLIPGMMTIEEQTKDIKRLHSHCNKTLETWAAFHKAKVDLTKLNRDGIVAPRTLLGIFKPFDMGIVRQSATKQGQQDKKEEEKELEATAQAVTATETEETKAVTREATTTEIKTTVTKATETEGATAVNPLDVPGEAEDEKEKLTLEELQRRAFLGSVPRDLATALDDLDPGFEAPPNAFCLFTVLPDSLSSPELKTKTWLDKAARLGREREEPFVLPDPEFDDDVRRPFFRVFPVLISGDSRDLMNSTVEAIQTVVHDTRIFQCRYRQYKSVVEFCAPRTGWMWRDKDINDHMHATHEGREALQESWRVMTDDVGLDPRGLNLKQAKGKKGEVRQHVIREVRDDGWIGPSGKLPRYMRRKLKKTPYLDEPQLKGDMLDHARNEDGVVDVESRGYTTGKLRKALRRKNKKKQNKKKKGHAA